MRGFLSMEIMLAVAIAAILVPAMLLEAAAFPKAAAGLRQRHEALSALRTFASALPAAAWVGYASTSQSAAAETSVTVEPDESSSFAYARNRATWTDLFGMARTLGIDTLLRASSTPPSACDPFTSGDWRSPSVRSTYELKSDGMLPATVPDGTYGMPIVAMAPGMLAVAAGSTTRAADPSIFFFRASGTSTLSYSTAFDNASTSRSGFSTLAAEDSTLFAGNGFGSMSGDACSDGFSCAQVQVFSWTETGTPARVGVLALATDSLPFAVTAQGKRAAASALATAHGLLFLGLQKTRAGDEFNIIDAHDPAHLAWTSGVRIGRTVTGITVRGSTAYVSTDDYDRELMLFDISDPLVPRLLGSWNAPGPSTFGYGVASTVRGNLIRFGRTYTPSGPEFELLDASTPSHIIAKVHADPGTFMDPESVTSLFTQGRNTFVLLTHRLEVWDTHAASGMGRIGSYTLPAGTRGTALACWNDQLLVARAAADGAGSIDIVTGI